MKTLPVVICSLLVMASWTTQTFAFAGLKSGALSTDKFDTLSQKMSTKNIAAKVGDSSNKLSTP